MRAAWLALFVLVGGISIDPAEGLKCRSGFNTTVFGFPIEFWKEATDCSSIFEQSCFIGEISYDNVLETDLSLTYGSCVSTAYQSELECENLFYGEDGVKVDLLLALLPDLQDQFSQAIEDFSEDAAKTVVEYIKNKNGELDNIKVVEAILTPLLNNTALKIPENVKPVVTKLDTLILTAFLNMSQFETALDDFLTSFGQLNTPDTYASKLLYDLFQRNNVTVPAKFNYMIENLPGFIIQFIKNEDLYPMVNETFFEIISGLDITDTESSVEALVSLLKQYVPSVANMDKFFDTIPELIKQLTDGNLEYVNQWNMKLLQVYSQITPATEALSNSTLNLLRRFGYYDYVEAEEQLNNSIVYFPGYFYNFFPTSEGIAALENALMIISGALDSVGVNPSFDLVELLQLLSVNLTEPAGLEEALDTVSKLVNVASTGNVTELGIQALSALKENAVITTESTAMANAIVEYVENFNVSIMPEIEEIIQNVPGLFIRAFPAYTDLINKIFANVTQNLKQIDMTNINYMEIFKNALAPITMVEDVPDQVVAVLEDLRTAINESDAFDTIENSLLMLEKSLPENMGDVMTVVNTLPELIQQMLNNNFAYLNDWNLELMKSFSKETPSTIRLSDSVMDMMERFGIAGNLTTEVVTIINHQPGYIYTFYELAGENSTELDKAYDTISQIVTYIDPTKPVNVSEVLSNFKYPKELNQFLAMLQGFINIATTADVNDMAAFAFELLKNSSTITSESSALSDAIIDILEGSNTTVPEEWKEVIRYIPGIFINGNPEQINLINSIYANISQGLEATNTASNDLNFNKTIESLTAQLSMLNITLTPEVQVLLFELPGKINASDPVGSITAVLEVITLALPSESVAILPLLNTLPDLLSELARENYAYLTTWQIQLLASYSTTSAATEALKDSVIQFMNGIGLGGFLDENMITWLTYQPGFFYQYFPGKSSEIDAAFYNISNILNNMDPINLDLGSLLKAMGVDMMGLPSLITSMETFIKSASTGDSITILSTATEMLKNLSVSTTEGDKLANAVIAIIDTAGVNDTNIRDIIRSIPGAIIALFPGQADMIKMIYDRTADGITDSLSNTFNIERSLNDLLTQLKAYGVAIPYEEIWMNQTLSFAKTLPGLIQQMIANNFTYLNTWNLEILKMFSKQTPTTILVSDSIMNLLERFGVADNLTSEMITLIKYEPGYMYLMLEYNGLNTTQLDEIFNIMAQGIDDVDPSKPVNIKQLLSSIPGFALSPDMNQFIEMVEEFINVATTGDVNQMGAFALAALKNSSTLTTESSGLSNSIIDFFGRLNLTLPEEWTEVIRYVPGIFVQAYPDQVALINTIYANITDGFIGASAGSELNFDQAVESLTAQLAMFNITLSSEVQTLLKELPSKINVSDPVRSINSVLEVVKLALPSEYDAVLPLLNSLPELASQLVAENYAYITTWQIQLLASYSTTSAATEALKDSVIQFMNGIGLGEFLTEDIITWLTYQPGYFYQYFPGKSTEIDFVYDTISNTLNNMDPMNLDLGSLLGSMGVNTTGFSDIITSLETLVKSATTGDPTAILASVTETLKNLSISTTEGDKLANAVIAILDGAGVNNTDVRNIVQDLPGAIIALFPAQADLIKMIYDQTADGMLNSLTNTFGLDQSLYNVITQLKNFGILVPYEEMWLNQTVSFVRTLPDLIQQMIANNFEYLNTWNLEIMKMFSKETPSTMAVSQSIMTLLQRFDVADNLTSDMITLINYQPGYVYQMFEYNGLNSTVLDQVYFMIAQAIDYIDPTKPLNLTEFLSLIPGVAYPPEMNQFIEMLEGFINVATTGDVNQMGAFALDALKKSSSLTTESSALSNSIIDFFGRMNLTLPEEWKEVIRYFPGIFVAAYPEQVTLINTIYANITGGFIGASSAGSDINLDHAVQGLTAQLALLNITLSTEAQALISALPSKINASDPVGSLNAVLEIMNLVIPPEYSAILPLFNTLPDLVSQLIAGNYVYINTWQIKLLELYSTTTPATLAFTNSVIQIIENMGVSSILTDDVRTWLTHQPGYFYQFFPGKSTEIDGVYYNISDILNKIDPMNPDLGELLKLMGVNTAELSDLITSLETFIQAASTGDPAVILSSSAEMLSNLSVSTAEGDKLATAIISILDSAGVNDSNIISIVRDIPGAIIALVPNQSDLIKMIFDRTADGITDSLMNTFDAEQAINDLLTLLTMYGLPIPYEEIWMNQTLSLAKTFPELIQQMMANNFTYLNTWNLELLKMFSKQTSPTIAVSDSIMNVLERFGVADNLTSEIITIIKYEPGYVYQMLEYNGLNSTQLDEIFHIIAQSIDNIDPSKPVNLTELLSLIPGFAYPPEMNQFIEMLEGFINVATTGDVNQIGAFALAALKNSSTLTTESSALSNSIIDFFGRMNLTLPEEWEEVIRYFPGIFVEAYPDQAALINMIYVNITDGFTGASATGSEINLDQAVESLTAQLAMFNITISSQAQILIKELPSKINASDPVGSLDAILEIMNMVIPPEYGAVLPLFNSLSDLLSQLMDGNYAYINTWQINLLKLYSTTTPATTAFTNSILQLLEGVGYMVTEDIRTWITYQPGYFYQFFPGKTAEIDNTLYAISDILSKMDPKNPDLDGLFSLMGINTTGMSELIGSLETFMGVASTGDINAIGNAAFKMLSNLTVDTVEGDQLANAIMALLDMAGVNITEEVKGMIRDIPGVIIVAFPGQSDLIKMIYNRTAAGIMSSLSNTVDIEQSINDAVTQLTASGITIPAEVLALGGKMNELIEALITGNVTEIEQWIVDILPLVSPNATSSSDALSNAVKHVLNQVTGIPSRDTIYATIEYLIKSPYSIFQGYAVVVDSVYDGMAKSLMNTNITSFDPESIKGAFDDLLPLIPSELHQLVTGLETLLTGLFTENRTVISEWGVAMQTQYCASNSYTTGFAKSLADSLDKYYAVSVPADIKTSFECIPGILYTFLPNQTEILNDVFGQYILWNENLTQYVEVQFQQINMTLPNDFVAFLNKFPALLSALFRNDTETAIALLVEVQNESAAETELSKLIITILERAGLILTDEIRTSIRQSANGFYNPSLAAYFPIMDSIFSSLNEDIAAGKDLGVAVKDAFTEAGIDIAAVIIPALDNLQPMMDAIMSQDLNAINTAVLNVLISYNASYPSDMLQLQIYQLQLQRIFQNLDYSTTINIPDEAFVYLEEIYHLTLKMVNVTEDSLKTMLMSVFPDGAPYIEVFFRLDPKHAFNAGVDFVTWIFDENRNASVLAVIIRDTINLLIDQENIDLGEMLMSLLKPTTCKYETCQADSCNSPSLLNQATVVTPQPTTTSPTTTTELLGTVPGTPVTTTAVQSSTASTTVSTTAASTTTSGGVVFSKSFNLSLALLSILFSTKWLLS